MPKEGTKQSDVDSLRREVEEAIGSAVDRLRAIEIDTQQLVRKSNLEQQHLDAFMDELHYRLRILTSPEQPPVTITGPLTEDQLVAMQSQQGALETRRAELGRLNTELEQLSNRLSWLVHQIESACDWVLRSGDKGPSKGGAVDGMQPDAGEQVMWAQIIMGQEAERARLAREIHDGPAQVLANSVLRLQFVEQMARQRPEDVPAEMERMRGALQASLQDLRRFIFDLRPVSLNDAGLIPTLQHYIRDYAEQFEVDVDANLPDNLVLSANQELVVFRVVQEALQNIHKHAAATKIEVDVRRRPEGVLVVSITDNGRGFDPSSARRRRPSSSGLVSMQERAATVGGSLKVDSRQDAGTTITLTLPMPKAS